MTAEVIATMLEISGKTYQLKCSPQEVDSIKTAAAFVEKKMQEVRQQFQVLTVDRVAVFAALNIAHEFLNGEQEKSQRLNLMNERLRELQDKIDSFFAQNAQMELQTAE